MSVDGIDLQDGDELPVVRVGDTMRFSVELLKQMVDDLPHVVLVRVKEIHTEEDGAKKLILERAD